MSMDDPDSIPDMFKDGVRAVLFFKRNKDGEIENPQKKSIKRITTSIQEWNETIREFSYIQRLTHPNHRIYSSINPRNLSRAIFEFNRRKVEADYQADPIKDLFYLDIQNNFFSCLMNPEAKLDNNFIIDCDSEEEYTIAKEKIPEELIIFEYHTKNGMHIITKPFYNFDVGGAEIKKDALMFIG